MVRRLFIKVIYIYILLLVKVIDLAVNKRKTDKTLNIFIHLI